MKRAATAVGLFMAVYAMRSIVLPRVLPPGQVEYRGETIRLSKWYFDYEDYEEDTGQFADDELPRVESLVTTAPIQPTFHNRMELYKAISAIRFPGYGSAHFGEKSQIDGSVLVGTSVEIPPGLKDRVIVYQERNGVFRLADDFIAPTEPSIMAVRYEEGFLVYRTLEGALVLKRPASRAAVNER